MAFGLFQMFGHVPEDCGVVKRMSDQINLNIPAELPSIVKEFARSAIFVQPENLAEFAEGYFGSISEGSKDEYVKAQAELSPRKSHQPAATSKRKPPEPIIAPQNASIIANVSGLNISVDMADAPDTKQQTMELPVSPSRGERTEPTVQELQQLLAPDQADAQQGRALEEAFARRASLGNATRHSQRRRSSLGAVDERLPGWNKEEEEKNKALAAAEAAQDDQSLEAFQEKLRRDREAAEFVPQKNMNIEEEEIEEAPGMTDDEKLAVQKKRGRRGSLAELAEERKRKYSTSDNDTSTAE